MTRIMPWVCRRAVHDSGSAEFLERQRFDGIARKTAPSAVQVPEDVDAKAGNFPHVVGEIRGVVAFESSRLVAPSMISNRHPVTCSMPSQRPA